MWRQTEKEKQLTFLHNERFAIAVWILRDLVKYGKLQLTLASNRPLLLYILHVEEKIIELQELRYGLGTRTGVVKKSSHWRRLTLPTYDMNRRVSWMRVDDNVFRLGHCGNAASVLKTAAWYGVSEGMVANATARVLVAFRKLSRKWIRWNDKVRRREQASIAHRDFGFEHCIGSVDGTTVPLACAPKVHLWTYYDRHSRFSVLALVTVNHEYEVINIITGSKGPAPDSRVQRGARWERNDEDYFCEDEYLVGDNGMLMSKRCVIPYKGESARSPENKFFNWLLAKLRVRSEHVIGHVKQRFESLKELRVRIHKAEDIYLCADWIIAAFKIPNICLKFNDTPIRWSRSFDETPTSPREIESEQLGTTSAAELVRRKAKASVFAAGARNGTITT